MHNLCPIYLLFLISDLQLQSLTDTEATEPKSKKSRNEMTKKKSFKGSLSLCVTTEKTSAMVQASQGVHKDERAHKSPNPQPPMQKEDRYKNVNSFRGWGGGSM